MITHLTLHCSSWLLQNCHELKNYEALFAIVDGLETSGVNKATVAWQVTNLATFCWPVHFPRYKEKCNVFTTINTDVIIGVCFQMVTEQLKMTFVELREMVSPELNYNKYKEEICSVNLAPCVPRLCKRVQWSFQMQYCITVSSKSS